jgi:cytoskeletal protein RodZ
MKKRKKSSWIAYWVGMGVLALGIVIMIIVLIANRSNPEQVALAPTATKSQLAQRPVETTVQQAPIASKPEANSPHPVESRTQSAANPKVDVQPNREETTDRTPVPPPATDPAPSSKIGIAVGNEASEVEAEDLQGKSFKLSDYRGKVVLLDFWGFW